jgi:hypothetical protein
MISEFELVTYLPHEPVAGYCGHGYETGSVTVKISRQLDWEIAW